MDLREEASCRTFVSLPASILDFLRHIYRVIVGRHLTYALLVPIHVTVVGKRNTCLNYIFLLLLCCLKVLTTP